MSSYLYSLIYVSQPCQPFDELGLMKLMKQSTEGNARTGITGMLLYKSSGFMQLIEGDMTSVQALYKNIRADKRHHAVRTVEYKRIESRQFPSWCMVLRGANSFDNDSPYKNVFKPEFDFNYFLKNPAEAAHLFSALSDDKSIQTTSNSMERVEVGLVSHGNQVVEQPDVGSTVVDNKMTNDAELYKTLVDVIHHNKNKQP